MFFVVYFSQMLLWSIVMTLLFHHNIITKVYHTDKYSYTKNYMKRKWLVNSIAHECCTIWPITGEIMFHHRLLDIGESIRSSARSSRFLVEEFADVSSWLADLSPTGQSAAITVSAPAMRNGSARLSTASCISAFPVPELQADKKTNFVPLSFIENIARGESMAGPQLDGSWSNCFLLKVLNPVRTIAADFRSLKKLPQ